MQINIGSVVNQAVTSNDWGPIKQALRDINLTVDEIRAYCESGKDGISTAGWTDRRLARFAEISFVQLIPFVMQRRGAQQLDVNLGLIIVDEDADPEDLELLIDDPVCPHGYSTSSECDLCEWSEYFKGGGEI